ncbi:MAG: hypothetical protein ACRD33_00100 [Candidatus Acidiferrales bacterium]
MPSIMLVNPRHRRRKHHTHRHMTAKQRKYFGNPRRKHHRHRARHHYHHNPSIRNIGGAVMPTLKGGLIGAAGGLGVDVVYGLLTNSMTSIPTFAANPAVATVGKLAMSILIGILGNMALRGKGGELAVGGATVAIHDFAKGQLATAMPTLPLGDYLTAAPTVGSRGKYALSRNYRAVGAYMTGRGARSRVSQPMGQYLSDTTFSNGIPVA